MLGPSKISRAYQLWSLNRAVFAKITDKWGVPLMVVMATASNAKVQRFCSLNPVDHPERVDYLSFSWSKMFVYAFPPMPLIPRVLKKISDRKASAIAIIPIWHT